MRVILPGLRSLWGSQPASLASSCTSTQSRVTPRSKRKPAATQATATNVRIACQSSTCTSSQPRQVFKNLKLSSTCFLGRTCLPRLTSLLVSTRANGRRDALACAMSLSFHYPCRSWNATPRYHQSHYPATRSRFSFLSVESEPG
jgi:hypothetical protein